MQESRNRKLPPLARMLAAAQVLAAAAALVWLGLNDPAASRTIPPCPTYRWAHIYCPGCGSLRATHRALTGRPVESLRYNAILLPLGAPALAVFAADRWLEAARGRGLRVRRWPRRAGWAILGLLAAFTVARNLPFEWCGWLRPPG